jgi:hypothetical protein
MKPTAIKDSGPCLYLQLPSKDILAKLKVGQKVTLTIKGKITGLSTSERDYGEGLEESNSLDISDYSVKMADVGKWEAVDDEEDD